MNKRCYLLFFSFFLLSGNPQSFASDDPSEKANAHTPLLSSYQPLSESGSTHEFKGPEGRGAGSAAAHQVTDTTGLSPSGTAPSLDDLLRELDLAPAQEGLKHVTHYLCVLRGIELQKIIDKHTEQTREVRKLTKEEKIVLKIKEAIAANYQSLCSNDERLEAHLCALARAAITESAPLRALLNEAIDKIEGLQSLSRQLIGENQTLKRQIEETHRLIRPQAANTVIPISSPQSTDMPDHQMAQATGMLDQREGFETLVRSNRCKCYAIGGLSTALGLSLIYGTWSLIHIFH